jgi:hypothetical protein
LCLGQLASDSPTSASQVVGIVGMLHSCLALSCSWVQISFGSFEPLDFSLSEELHLALAHSLLLNREIWCGPIKNFT